MTHERHTFKRLTLLLFLNLSPLFGGPERCDNLLVTAEETESVSTLDSENSPGESLEQGVFIS